MTLREIDLYFLNKEEPVKGCLLFLREYILKQDPNITETWKYKMPIYCYKGKMLCYLWIHKKYKKPYLGIVEGAKIEHPDLVAEKRARMKILLIDPEKDLPIKKLNSIMKMVLKLRKD
jgi:hypothetical protein